MLLWNLMKGGSDRDFLLLQLTQIRPSGIIECQNPQKGTGGKAVDFLLIRMGQNMGKTSLDTAAWITLCDACL